MLVTLTKKVEGNYTGPTLKITVHAYIIESIDNFDAGEEGCTLTIRTGKDERVTYECLESHAEATKLWEEAFPNLTCHTPVLPPEKNPPKKKVVRSTGPLPAVPVKKAPKKKVVKKAVMKKVADKAAKKVVKKLLAKKSK